MNRDALYIFALGAMTCLWFASHKENLDLREAFSLASIEAQECAEREALASPMIPNPQ